MSSDDIKIILRKFYIRLRNTVQPQDIAPIIDGLTDFDRQQIAATAKNEGSMLGNDKLLDTLGRRTTRSFISFITHLSESNSELAEEIKEYTFKYFQHIHNSFQNYQREQTRPFATVKPSVTTHSSSETHSHSRSALSHLPGAVPQSLHRTTELRPPTFTEDILLEDVPNNVFSKWATELNHGDSLNKLGDILQLPRKQIRELKNKSNPGEEILDLLSSEEEVTVKGLVDLLHSAQLSRVVDIIKQSLEPTVHEEFTNKSEFTDRMETHTVHDEFTNRSEFTDRRETHTSRTENTSSTPNQQSFRMPIEEYEVDADIQQMLFSDDVGEEVKTEIVQQLKKGRKGPSTSAMPTTDRSENVGQSTSSTKGDSNNDQVTHDRWVEKNEKLLVETRADMESELWSNKAGAQPWNKILQKMASYNVKKQAQDKWKNFRKKFQNNKTENSKEDCKVYTTFSNLYGAKSSTFPKCTLDTDKDIDDKGDTFENLPSTSSNTDKSLDKPPAPKTNVKKRKFEIIQNLCQVATKLPNSLKKKTKKNDEF